MRQADLAAELGDRYDQTMISAVERGRSALLFDGMVKAARVLHVSLDYLGGLTDHSEPVSRDGVRLVGRYQMIPRFATGPSDMPGSASRHVGRWDLSAAAGDGAPFEDALRTGYASFDGKWCEDRGLHPEQCAVLSVHGESMEPTLPDGCSILVDRARRTRRSNHLFVVGTEDGLIVKRLARSGRDWILSSDNPGWGPVAWPERGELVGEVVWAARSFI